MWGFIFVACLVGIAVWGWAEWINTVLDSRRDDEWAKVWEDEHGPS